MAKLYLKFKGALVKELTLSHEIVTIGRLPDNTIQIEHLAVSGHHARISWASDHYVVEDLGSLNGTYVNHNKVGRQSLKDGDVIYVGEHVLSIAIEQPQEAIIDAGAGVAEAEKTAPEKAIAITPPATPSKTASPVADVSKSPVSAPEKIGILKVIVGKTDREQYSLTGKMSVIGKSEMASIKLTGWLAPQMAALISRRENGYMIAASEKDVKVMVNGETIQGHRDLRAGDVIEVAGVKMTFSE